MKNYYVMLEVSAGCSTEEIRQSYRRLVQEHLDDAVVFAELRDAYEVLSSPLRRAEYDQTLQGAEAAALPGTMASALGMGRSCPLGADAQCPVLQGRLALTETYCSECGYALAGFQSSASFEAEAPAAAGRAWLKDDGGRTHLLRFGLNSVGRENGDVLASDKTVSRSHARLMLGEDGTLTVEDLGSTNGTRVGDETLAPQAARSLADADRLRFGSVSFTVHLPSEAAMAGAAPSAAAELPAEDTVPTENAFAENAFAENAFAENAFAENAFAENASPSGAARAQVVDLREGAERVFPLLPGLTTFGRRSENSMVISGDLYVSGSHAQIVADGNVFILTDVGSTNGTLLNGERIPIDTPFTLDSGDEILIGGTALRFERHAEAEEGAKAAPEEAASEEMPAEEMPEANAEDAPEHSKGQL